MAKNIDGSGDQNIDKAVDLYFRIFVVSLLLVRYSIPHCSICDGCYPECTDNLRFLHIWMLSQIVDFAPSHYQ